MATNAEANALGFATPSGSSLIKTGDNDIAQNARATVELFRQDGFLLDRMTVTATTVPYGSPPTASIGGTLANKVINLGLPQGPQGVPGMGYAEGQQLLADSSAVVADSTTLIGDYGDLVTRAENAEAAAFAEPDAAMATVITNPATATRAALTADFTERAVMPVNLGAYEGTNDAAVREAFTDALAAGRPVEVPDKTFNLTGDLVLQPTAQSERFSIVGTGDKSQLTFSDGGLKISGTGMLAHRPTLRDLNIRRTGTSGPALWLHGDGAAGTGVARWEAINCYVVSTQGTACLIEGSYIGDFIGCYFLSSVDGVKVVREAARGITGANAVNFLGGEIQGNQRGATLTAAYGVSFLGTSIEGNSVYGVDLGDECNGTTFHGIYCEGNAGWDVRVAATSTSTPMGGVSIHGGTFLDAGKNKASSIELVKGQGIDIAGNYFGNQSAAPIRVSEAVAGDVVGGQRNNLRHYPMPGNPQPVVNYGTTGAPSFDKAGSGRVYAISSDVGSVPAGSTVQVALTALGVRVNDLCSVSTRSLLEPGLIPIATVTAADTIVLRVANVTSSAIDPAGRTWDFRVSR